MPPAPTPPLLFDYPALVIHLPYFVCIEGGLLSVQKSNQQLVNSRYRWSKYLKAREIELSPRVVNGLAADTTSPFRLRRLVLECFTDHSINIAFHSTQKKRLFHSFWCELLDLLVLLTSQVWSSQGVESIFLFGCRNQRGKRREQVRDLGQSYSELKICFTKHWIYTSMTNFTFPVQIMLDKMLLKVYKIIVVCLF